VKEKPSVVLLVAAAKFGWGEWDQPCVLSPNEHAALKEAGLLDSRSECSRWLAKQWNGTLAIPAKPKKKARKK
jgi:hypothetical protein